MITALSGRQHSVISAVVLVFPKAKTEEQKVLAFAEETVVEFAELSRNEIEAYVDMGECMLSVLMRAFLRTRVRRLFSLFLLLPASCVIAFP